MNAPERVAVAERAARAGAAVAHDWFRTDLDIETKRDETDPVTEADRRAQERVVSEIRRVYPDDTVVGEETGTVSTLPAHGVAWVVDPIDGTTNHVRGNPQWATAVTVVRDRYPVAAVHVMPALGDAYVAGPDRLEVNGEVATVSDRTDPKRFADDGMGQRRPGRRGIGLWRTRRAVRTRPTVRHGIGHAVDDRDGPA
jgi:myo-inositol-1(or 4)-monophosphatase